MGKYLIRVNAAAGVVTELDSHPDRS